MTAQDLLVRLKGSTDGQIYTLGHITDTGECFLIKLLDEKSEGSIMKVAYLHVEPIGFNPLVTKNFESVPKQDPEVVFIIGQVPPTLETSGLYPGRLSQAVYRMGRYKNDYGVNDCVILGHLTADGVLHRSSEQVTQDQLKDILKQLTAQTKEAIKEGEDQASVK